MPDQVRHDGQTLGTFITYDTLCFAGMTKSDNSNTQTGSTALQNYKKISLIPAVAYSLFGYMASILSQGMKGPNGPTLAAIFIFTIMTMDLVLVRRHFSLKQVNSINLVSIVSFYFFSIALPLFLTCPSPLTPILALLVFSLVTFIGFSIILYLMKRVLDKIRYKQSRDDSIVWFKCCFRNSTLY